jgi:hypothetical protein
MWEVRGALRQARRFRSHAAEISVCWDLDNTLVDSGALLRVGNSLPDAIVRAGPVPNMLEFYWEVHTALPQAKHFILTARRRAMRRATEEWLIRHQVANGDTSLCFVPYVEAKVKVWEQLAGSAKLVIVDDLSYNHETEQVAVRDDLVAIARQTASVYIGLSEISEVAADPGAAVPLALRAAGLLAS